MAGYLFVHFTGESEKGEQIYFSVSKDGLHWKDLNHGEPVLTSKIGMCGVRDPFPVRNPLDGKVYLIATDLRIASGYGWQAAQENGSRDLIIWETDDLIHWSSERSYTIGIQSAGCVWAPEAVFDVEKNEFLVFFASKVKYEEENVGKHRIYAAYTKDFKSFSDTFLYIERDRDVIDTTILQSGDNYYRISKDESNSRLLMEVSNTLLGNFVKIESAVLSQLAGVEGPEGYLLPDGKTWCLIADQFAEGKGYLPMVTENLAEGDFQVLHGCDYDMGITHKRHGGVLLISDEEYDRLCAVYA